MLDLDGQRGLVNLEGSRSRDSPGEDSTDSTLVSSVKILDTIVACPSHPREC